MRECVVLWYLQALLLPSACLHAFQCEVYITLPPHPCPCHPAELRARPEGLHLPAAALQEDPARRCAARLQVLSALIRARTPRPVLRLLSALAPPPRMLP